MATAEQATRDFGVRMRQLREARGVSLRQIADATKISVGALQALERSDTSRLPGGVFSRAFVRSYAVEVGLDPEQAVRDFLVQFPDAAMTGRNARLTHDHRSARETRPRSASTIVALVAVSALLGVILFVVLASRP
jgi:cytoskeletal protein RodZ